MFRSYLKRAGIFLLISIVLEICVFNYKALTSLNAADRNVDVYWSGEGYVAIGDLGDSGYVYLGIESMEETQETVSVPVYFTVFIKDEGNRDFYEIGEVDLLPLIEESRYLKIHSYGNITGIHIVPREDSAAVMKVTEIIGDARVPWFFSPARVLVIFGVFCLGYLLRPGSALYNRKWTRWQEFGGTGVLVAVNIMFFLLLVRSNPSFLNPIWPYHTQYQELAVSLSRGQVTINEGKERYLEELQQLDNPYDNRMRRETIGGIDEVWDTCYYKGNFYVYFGIVPVLLFYLPYYLIFHSAFPTWAAVFVSGSFCVGGVYYLLAKIRRRWFPESSFLWYLILAAIMSNGMQLSCAMLRADFYYLPIVTALAFSLWGVGLVFAAAEKPDGSACIWKLALGTFCLALTAGCRPQFLVGSVLVLPIVLPILFAIGKNRKALWRWLAYIVPYLTVAAGVMYYNLIRFGSVFDFGANYNLTTNDMTRRGLQLGRIPDGIFMYLLQAPNWKLQFPFAEITNYYSGYLGETIRDWTYGGVLWTHAILFGAIGILAARKSEKVKGAFRFLVLSLIMGLVVLIADTEMAGILNRYCMDFLWLLMIPAMIGLFHIWDCSKGTKWFRWLVVLVLLLGVGQMIYELGIAVRGSGIMSNNAYRYYGIKAWFS